MKFLPVHLSHFLSNREARRNLRVLFRVFLILSGFIAVSAIGFHFLMAYEGQQHSWFTGVYWTLTVMSTLGFGDITFHTDLGRLFSTVVLISGIVLLLIVMPFAFIRFFYAPWLESQLRTRAPRKASPGLADHLIIVAYDNIAPALAEKLEVIGRPCLVLEPDPAVATRLHLEGVNVMQGEVDSVDTYRRANIDDARLVLANASDTVNTNIILTVREANPNVPVAALAELEDSIDILELSGASTVLPLKRTLGEQLAHRVRGGGAEIQRIGTYRDLVVAELPARGTFLESCTLRETQLRQRTGVSVVAVWERGRLVSAGPDLRLGQHSFPVVIGTASQLAALKELLPPPEPGPDHPVLVIGGGKVGRAATRALHRRGLRVHIVERNEALQARLTGLPDELFIGDAADRELLEQAGLSQAPAVVLSTNDDAMNIYLAVYCRKLKPAIHIVSRITHRRNIEAMTRAGADFTLSFISLGVGAIHSLLRGRDLIVLGEGVDLFYIQTPGSLARRTVAESGIGARTGLSIIAVRQGEEVFTNPPRDLRLHPGSEILALGTLRQRQEFVEIFGSR